MNIKLTVVAQVARYLMEIFSLRFKSAGSLYLDPQLPHFVVGPIVSTPFYRAIDGEVREPEPGPNRPLSQIPDPKRGPYSSVSEYLSGGLRKELEFIATHRSLAVAEIGPRENDPSGAEGVLEHGVRVIKKAIELCHLYPGDILLPANITTPQTPFSIKLDDFRLSNIMVCPLMLFVASSIHMC
jgi:hypothetical protein